MNKCPHCKELEAKLRKYIRLGQRLVDQGIFILDDGDEEVRIPSEDFTKFRKYINAQD